MMYRRTEDVDEDDSTSDWDELTPRHHASSPSALLSPALAPTTVTIQLPTSSSTPLVEASVEQITLLHPTKTSSPLQSHAPTLNSVKREGIGLSTTLPSRTTHSYRYSDPEAGVGTVAPFQQELTSLATVKTPQPPPPKTPPSAKPVYRVQEQEDEVAGVVPGEGGGGGEERPTSAAGGGGDVSGVKLEYTRGMDRDYRVDLEFTTVSGQRVDYLSPSTQPPKAYMSNIAAKWEGHSQRCVEECCSTLRLVTDFLIAVILGSTHCILRHVLGKLCCGLGHILADALCKPLVVLIFNGLLWPLVAGCVQLSKGTVLVVGPLLEILGVVMSWVVQVARACRLVTVNNKPFHQSPHQKHSSHTV